MLVYVYGVYDITYVSLSQGVVYVIAPLAYLLEGSCAYAVFLEESGCASCGFDVETEIVESLYQRKSPLLVGIGYGAEYGTVVHYLQSRSLQRLV